MARVRLTDQAAQEEDKVDMGAADSAWTQGVAAGLTVVLEVVVEGLFMADLPDVVL